MGEEACKKGNIMAPNVPLITGDFPCGGRQAAEHEAPPCARPGSGRLPHPLLPCHLEEEPRCTVSRPHGLQLQLCR